MSTDNKHHAGNSTQKFHAVLTLTALGVVFGDIGTSPLYAIRECFFGSHAIPPSAENIFGILSLIFWALIMTICIEYQGIVLKADNRGEGGVMALTALLHPRTRNPVVKRSTLLLLGLFGTSLLYGDSMLTSAISVLSAVEGLKVATTAFDDYIIPLTLIILSCLFLVQRHGTTKIGFIFGPVILVWFLSIGFLGLNSISHSPDVLWAINPSYAIQFLINHGWSSMWIIGCVFLVVTGGEAMYADMGHFGRIPIRHAWFMVALPCLTLNYFGQGALLLRDQNAVYNPFYLLVPDWALIPMVALATAATAVASQAVISGAFSLTRQAVQLGYLPRLQIVHTSSDAIGQIYIPQLNYALLIATLWLVLEFRSSSSLASAYGFAVSCTMIITLILLYFVARVRWRWTRYKALLILLPFFIIDAIYLGSNIIKIGHGGWFPLAMGLAVFTLMTTWCRGREILGERLRHKSIPFEHFVLEMANTGVSRVPGTAIFMNRSIDNTPPALLHNVKHNKVLHEQVIMLMVVTEEIPRVPREERVEMQDLGKGFYRVVVHYGFSDTPNIPEALKSLTNQGINLRFGETTYFLGRETLIATELQGMAIWRERLFAFLSRNAERATTFFHIPPQQVIEIGMQVEL